MSSGARIDCDVLIVGGGLVGSLLANALSHLPLDVVLVEARRVETLSQPSFDSRATALANGSQRVLAQLGLWNYMRTDAQPITQIHIGEQGRFGAARISAVEEGVTALGYTVENRVLGESFWSPLAKAPRFRCLEEAALLTFSHAGQVTEANIAVDGAETTVRCRLLVAADGAGSKIREASGISAEVDDYRQKAIIVNCATEEPHAGRAFERFITEGPLAVLPLTRNRVAVVWTLPAAKADSMLGFSDDDFRQQLQAAFGFRLGRFTQIGRRDMHSLRRVRSSDVTAERTVLIGNAAVALHPVAGQGFNLALRDVASLAELIAESLAQGEPAIGGEALLARYREWRERDQKKLAGFTHGLVRGFGADAGGIDLVRGIGLMTFDLLPGAKSTLARHTMGMGGRVPRLARGLDLI
jgi:2-octaprenyl-6-methoxyphenol hydroxylase